MGSLGATPVVGATDTCLPNEQYSALVASKDDALRKWGETQTQRWYFLVAGAAIGAAAMHVLMRRK